MTNTHPLQPVLAAMRTAILAADPRIAEGVKWNSPSFHIADAHFATFHLRAADRVQLILHLGAKPRPGVKLRADIADPTGMLEWRGADRAIVTVRSVAEAEAIAPALTEVVRQWVRVL